MATTSSAIPTVLSSITGCLNTGAYSDLIIECRGERWQVHRVIVCSQSKVLHAASTNGFQESSTGIINLPDDDPSVVRTMLEFLYSGDYTTDAKDDNSSASDDTLNLNLSLKHHAQVFNLADKYDIPSLAQTATRNFARTLEKGVEPLAYLSAISEVYLIPSASVAIRSLAVQFARGSFRDWMTDEEFVRDSREVVASVPEFAYDLLELFVKEQESCECPDCGHYHPTVKPQKRCSGCKKGVTYGFY